jgi:cell division protein ZipA
MSSNGEEFFLSLRLPTKGTEDASHLLHKWVIEKPHDQVREYRPSDKVDWVVHIDLPPGTVLTRDTIEKILPERWRDQHLYPDVYGFSPDQKRWTFPNAGDVPDSYSGFQLAWKLRSMDNEALSEKQLDSCLTATREAAHGLNGSNVWAASSSEEGATRSARLLQLVKSCDVNVIVVLRASERNRFEGRAIWDVMLSLGLRWGDMDLFHWENPGVPGQDYFFSVWTSTTPGYFLPEDIGMGQVRTQDLVFGFFVPRTWRPEVVLDSMLRAVHYAKRRLGGRILDRSGSDLSEAKLKADIQQTTAAMAAAGFPLGSDEALYLFGG